MRISDWSSDVCSSDLTIFVARTDRMGIARQIADLRDALVQAWPVTIFPEGTTSGADELLAFKASLLAALEPPPPGVIDRKSVVSGKSVSVRVDLGGRRIIKKKTKTTMNTPNRN